MFVHVLVSGDVTARDVRADFGARSLRLAICSVTVVAGELPLAIHPDDCTWQFGARSAYICPRPCCPGRQLGVFSV